MSSIFPITITPQPWRILRDAFGFVSTVISEGQWFGEPLSNGSLRISMPNVGYVLVLEADEYTLEASSLGYLLKLKQGFVLDHPNLIPLSYLDGCPQIPTEILSKPAYFPTLTWEWDGWRWKRIA